MRDKDRRDRGRSYRESREMKVSYAYVLQFEQYALLGLGTMFIVVPRFFPTLMFHQQHANIESSIDFTIRIIGGFMYFVAYTMMKQNILSFKNQQQRLQQIAHYRHAFTGLHFYLTCLALYTQILQPFATLPTFTFFTMYHCIMTITHFVCW